MELKWRTDFDNIPEGDPNTLLLYSLHLDADEDFSGHPYMFSNRQYARVKANTDVWTHWAEISVPKR